MGEANKTKLESSIKRIILNQNEQKKEKKNAFYK